MFVGYCPQFDAVIKEMSGEETLYMFARIRGISEREIPRIVQAVVEAVGIQKHASRQIKTYRYAPHIEVVVYRLVSVSASLAVATSAVSAWVSRWSAFPTSSYWTSQPPESIRRQGEPSGMCSRR